MTLSDSESWEWRARSFGSRAAEYAKYRPGYPAAVTDWALETCGEKGALDVFDLGAGTSKPTANLVARAATVTAVEPDDQMRAYLACQYPQVAAKAGSAEEIPLPESSMDAVLIGQEFHWFDAARALPVNRASTTLWWNVRRTVEH